MDSKGGSMKAIYYIFSCIQILVRALKFEKDEIYLNSKGVVSINAGFIFTTVVSSFCSLAPSIFLFNIVHLNYYWLIETNFTIFVFIFSLHVLCVVAAIITGIYLCMWLFEKKEKNKNKIYKDTIYYILNGSCYCIY